MTLIGEDCERGNFIRETSESPPSSPKPSGAGDDTRAKMDASPAPSPVNVSGSYKPRKIYSIGLLKRVMCIKENEGKEKDQGSAKKAKKSNKDEIEQAVVKKESTKVDGEDPTVAGGSTVEEDILDSSCSDQLEKGGESQSKSSDSENSESEEGEGDEDDFVVVPAKEDAEGEDEIDSKKSDREGDTRHGDNDDDDDDVDEQELELKQALPVWGDDDEDYIGEDQIEDYEREERNGKNLKSSSPQKKKNQNKGPPRLKEAF